MRRPITGITLLVATLAASPGSTADDPDWLACSDTRRPDRIAACTHVINVDDPKIDPEDRARVFVNRAEAWSARGEHDRAIADYDQALRLDPADIETELGRAKARADKGDLERAVAEYSDLLRRHPEFRRAWLGRAEAWRAAGDQSRAIADCAQAIRLDRGNPHNCVR